MNWWASIVAIVAWQNIANIYVEASTNSAKATKMQACTKGKLTLYCQADRNGNAVQDFEWKMKFLNTGWIKFSSCVNASGVINCFVHRAMLADGITLLNNSNGSVTIERSASKASHDHAQIMCQVHYFDHSVPPSHIIYDVNFNTQCVRIQEGRDLNLTKVLLNKLPCKRVVDIEWYDVTGSRFTYCNACQVCTITKDNNHPVPVFWNRLQFTGRSLLLTEIQASDNNRKIVVKVHTKGRTLLAKRNMAANMQKPLVYTIRIFVGSGHNSQGPSLIAPPTTRSNSPSLPSSGYTGSPKKRSATTAHGQEWTVVVMALAMFLGIVFAS